MSINRIIEIDLLRTLAILMMIVYHIAYDLSAFHDFPIDLFGDAWQTFRILTASLFLLIAGVTSNFTHKPLRRSAIVICCALLITAATYVYDPQTFIYFGILHCIGLGMLLLIPLKHLKELNILLGIIITLLPSPYALRPTLDYYPPTPWIGLMLIGCGIGHYLYVRNDLRLPIGNIPSFITLPGRHSLVIYVTHQPIILGMLYLMKLLSFSAA